VHGGPEGQLRVRPESATWQAWAAPAGHLHLTLRQGGLSPDKRGSRGRKCRQEDSQNDAITLEIRPRDP